MQRRGWSELIANGACLDRRKKIRDLGRGCPKSLLRRSGCGGRVDIHLSNFVRGKHATFPFPFAKRFEIDRPVFLALHTHNPFFGHGISIQHPASRIQ